MGTANTVIPGGFPGPTQCRLEQPAPAIQAPCLKQEVTLHYPRNCFQCVYPRNCFQCVYLLDLIMYNVSVHYTIKIRPEHKIRQKIYRLDLRSVYKHKASNPSGNAV